MACSNKLAETIKCRTNTVPFKPFMDVCLEADMNKENERALKMLWNQIVIHKKKYSLVHLRFMREHIMGHYKLNS